MYQLIFKPKALEMLEHAYHWYEQKQEGLGDIFLQSVEICYGKLQSAPVAYGKINNRYRQLIIPRFPYVIAFEIIKNEVIVLAVFHTSRNPKEKLKRK